MILKTGNEYVLSSGFPIRPEIFDRAMEGDVLFEFVDFDHDDCDGWELRYADRYMPGYWAGYSASVDS